MGAKKAICLFFVLFVYLLAPVTAYAISTADITAETAVLIDADTGQVLFDKNMDVRRHPASITKIMTGLLVMENCSPDDKAIVSEEAVNIPYNTSHIALTPGEELPVDSLMYAMMLPSANDAANVLAEHVAGTQSEFALMMTKRAAELGALSTNFSNPHGLDEPFHYTTAHDMALITRAAIANEGFLRYFGTGRHTIPPTNMQSKERPFTNQQFMLLPDMWVYNPNVIGGKVGFTDEAKHTMSTAASEGGRTLIAVVMGCSIDEKFYDTQALFDYGFEFFHQVKIPEEKLSGFTVPVTENGESIGEAVFSAEKISALLLPEGMGADDIRYNYKLPQSLERGEPAAAAVTITLARQPGGGAPTLLLELPLIADLRYDITPGGVRIDDSPREIGSRSFWSIIIWPVYAIAVILPLLVILKKARIARRRARRMARIEQATRMRRL